MAAEDQTTQHMLPSAPALPRLKQGSEKPVFIDRGTEKFLCAKCGALLISGYVERKIVGVPIECFSCNSVTTTAAWPDSEPLPPKVLTLGSNGTYLLGNSVDLRSKEIVVTIDQIIQRASQLTHAVRARETPLDLSAAGFERIEKRLTELFTDFPACAKRTAVAFNRRNERFMKHPPVWAFELLKRRFSQPEVNLDKHCEMALAYLNLVLHLAERWGNHLLFASLVHALLYDFHHSITLLTAATYLADLGNPVGFASPVNGGGRTADMFVNIAPETKAMLEVKAPTDFQWPNPLPGQNRVRSLVQEKLKRSIGQITEERPGFLVLGGSIPGLEESLKEALAALVSEDLIPRRIAGVITVNLTSHVDRLPIGTQPSSHTEAKIDRVINPRSRFSGVLAG